MNPLLKWAGGKRHVAPLLLSHFPKNWNDGKYFEPFLGGAAMFLHVTPKNAVLADINEHLVRFYLDVQKQPENLVAQIRSISETFDHYDGHTEVGLEAAQVYFYELRERFNSNCYPDQQSALLYALNKLCFNGLYRENSKGAFNVPFGKKKAFPKFDDADFFKVSTLLQDSKIWNRDFEATVSEACSGDFVYFDPPYVPVDETAKFTSYSSAGFGLNEQKRLSALMGELADRGVRALLSNSATEITRDIYKPFRQMTISAPRMVSAKSSSRKPIDELLIMNY